MTLTGSGRPEGGAHAGDASGASPVGSVAEEAARLIEMLSATGGPWARGSHDDSTATRHDTAHQAGSTHSEEPGVEGAQPGACTCGGTTPPACRLCPVCQLIAFVSSVSPETVDRAADLVDLAATALRDLAAAQRARRPAPDATTSTDGQEP